MSGLHPARNRDNLGAVITRSSLLSGRSNGARSNRSAVVLCALLAAVAGFTSGCGTFMNQRTGDHVVYGGVKRDWRDLKAESVPEGMALVTSLDLPLSAIADTFCLPVDWSKSKD